MDTVIVSNRDQQLSRLQNYLCWRILKLSFKIEEIIYLLGRTAEVQEKSSEWKNFPNSRTVATL